MASLIEAPSSQLRTSKHQRIFSGEGGAKKSVEKNFPGVFETEERA